MSKRESIARYTLIIKKLRKHPASFNEILDYLSIESELQEYDFIVSRRTFQRDLDDIRLLYNIDIRYDFSRRVYFIDYDQLPEVSERIMEAFDIFNALNVTDRLSGFIHFESRRPQGTEHLYGLLHAIRNRVAVEFIYTKFRDDRPERRTVEPYALKEFRNRWYVLAFERKGGMVKTFALDRLTELVITRKPFSTPVAFDVTEHFRHCFGIIGPDGEKPREVELSFDPVQGKYVRSLPLHPSQEIVRDTAEELVIRLRVFITHDFVMELLSYGAQVKVLRPASLANRLKRSYEAALKKYDGGPAGLM